MPAFGCSAQFGRCAHSIKRKARLRSCERSMH